MSLLSDLYQKYGAPLAARIGNDVHVAENAVHNFNQGTTGWQQAVQHALPSVSPQVSQALDSRIRYAVAPVGQFAGAIASPIQGAINTVRDVPALGYGSLGSIIPGHTFQGNIQQFNKVIPPANFATKATQNLIHQNILPPVANTVTKGGELAGSMAIPLPGAGEIKALEKARPLAKLAGYTGLRAAEGYGYSAGTNLAETGDFKQANKAGLIGAATAGVANVALSPKLTGAAIKDVGNQITFKATPPGANYAPGRVGKPTEKQQAILEANSGIRDRNIVDTLQTAQENGAKVIPPPKGVVEPPTGAVLQDSNGLSSKEQAKLALQNRDAVMKQVEAHASITQQIADRANLKDKDAELFRDAIEHPEDLARNAAHARDPQAFTEATARYRAFTDTAHAIANESGRTIPYRQNYYNHEFDTNALPPQAKDEFAQYSQAKLRNAGNKSELPRTFNDLREARQYGDYLKGKYKLENNPFLQKNSTVSQDIADMASRVQRSSGASAFINTLKKIAPNDISVGTTDNVPAGFRQLPPSTGLGDTFVSPDLYKHLNVLEPSAFAGNKVVKALDTLNTGQKHLTLQGPFHAIREAINFAGSQLGQLKFPAPDLGARYAVSPTAFLNYMKQNEASGLLDTAAKLNLNLSASDFKKLSSEGTSKLGGYSIKSATFERLIPFYKLETLKTALGRTNLDLNTPEGLKTGREIAAQVNNFYGGLNREISGRSATTQQLLRFAFLAPDFNEGKLRTVVNAFNPTAGKAGGLARAQLIGQVAVTAIAVEVARRFATGKFDNLKGLLANTLLSPNVPLPSSFNKPGKDVQQTLNVPGNIGADVYRAVTDPGHALQSRGSSLVSDATKFISGKDFYGNPLVDPFKNSNPSALDKVKEIGLSDLPIPANNALQAVRGKISTPAAIANSLGGRVVNNPEDPKQIANTKYFKNLDVFKAGLNPNETALFGAVSPVKKGSDGNPVFDKAATTSAANAGSLASQPAFAQKFSQFQRDNGSLDPIYKLTGDNLINALQARAATGLTNKSSLNPDSPSAGNSASIYLKNFPLFTGQQAYEKTAGAGNYDPLYDLSDSNAKQVLYVRTLNSVEASGDPTATAIKAQPWYKQFNQNEQSWYKAHPLPSSVATKSSVAPYPEMPQNLSDYAHYISTLPTSAAKSQAYNTPTGKALDQYYSTLDQYKSQKQANLLGTSLTVPATKYAPGYTATPNGLVSAPGTSASASAGIPASSANSLTVQPGGGATGSSNGWNAYYNLKARDRVKSVTKLIKSKEAKIGKIKQPKSSGFKKVKVKAHVRQIKIKKPNLT